MNFTKEEITKLLKFYKTLNPTLQENIVNSRNNDKSKKIICFLQELTSIGFFEIFSDLRETSISGVYRTRLFAFTPYEYQLICSLMTVKQNYENLVLKTNEVKPQQKIIKLV